MNQYNSRELIIDIDDRVDALIQEINQAPSGAGVDFAEGLRTVVIGSILGPFGLSASMFDDRDGGNVTTVHNFEHGVVANPLDAARYEAYRAAQTGPFDRADYERSLPGERKKAFQTESAIRDAYTGQDLPKDGRAVRDHVVSAHEVEMSSKGHLAQSRAERVETANQHGNKVWTETSANSSKSDKDLLIWADSPNAKDRTRTNAEVYGTDPEKLKVTYAIAREVVDRKQNVAVLKKQATEFMKQGGLEAGKLAFRQVIGLVLKDLVEGLIQDIKALIRHGFESVSHLVELLKQRLKTTVANLKERWADYLQEGISAGISGFLSSLVTLLVNALVTTAKRVVTIIREATLAVVKSVKLIISPEPGMTGSDVAIEVLKLLAGSVVTAIALGLQETVAKMLSSIPLLAPLAEEISGVAVGILSGVAGLLTVLAFDRLQSFIAFRNKQLADVHRGQAVTFLKIQRTVIAIGEAQAFVANTSENLRFQLAEDWADVKESQEMASQVIEDYSESSDSLKNILMRL